MKDIHIPLFDEEVPKIQTFIQVCRPHKRNAQPIGVTSYVTLHHSTDIEEIKDWAERYNKKFNINCFGEDLINTIKLHIQKGDFYFVYNKKDEKIALFSLYIEEYSLRGTEYENLPVITIPNTMFMSDDPNSLDILSSMTGEIILQIKQKYFDCPLFLNFELCGNAYSNTLYFKFLLNYAVWGDRTYISDGCNLLCYIADAKRKSDKNIVHYLNSNPTSQDIAVYKKAAKKMLNKVKLEVEPVGKKVSARLDSIILMKELYKKLDVETFTLPINKIDGAHYGLINQECNKIYKSGRQLCPIFINDKFEIVWGNDIYEFMEAKGAVTIDCVLVDDALLKDLQLGYLCAVTCYLIDAPVETVIGKYCLDSLIAKTKKLFEDDADLIDMYNYVNVTQKYKNIPIPDESAIRTAFLDYLMKGEWSDKLEPMKKYMNKNYKEFMTELVVFDI
jgi:hypothetical protein